jgi:hypothetical protein
MLEVLWLHCLVKHAGCGVILPHRQIFWPYSAYGSTYITLCCAFVQLRGGSGCSCVQGAVFNVPYMRYQQKLYAMTRLSCCDAAEMHSVLVV